MFTSVDNPRYSGVAERAFTLTSDSTLAARIQAERASILISDAALAGRIQATELYAGASNHLSLRAEVVSWACDVLDRTDTTAYMPSRQVSIRDDVVWFTPPRGELLPFFKPAVCRAKRDDQSQPKAQDHYYGGLSVDPFEDNSRVLTANRLIPTTRNVTWRHIPSAPSVRHNVPLTSKRGSRQRGRAIMERVRHVKAEKG